MVMNKTRRRRLIAAALVAVVTLGATIAGSLRQLEGSQPEAPKTQQIASSPAFDALNKLSVKGRAPKTGYSRAQFGDGWQDLGMCDVRNHILRRDMQNAEVRSAGDCTVLKGTLVDPYTGKTIQFTRGADTSDDVQIDHVVALSDAWQKGAQSLDTDRRRALANDPLNLLAVDGKTNNAKSDSDAASWLPSNKAYRCRYVARQIAVKTKYLLWVTAAERDAMAGVLSGCPNQMLPIESLPS
jgi:hypothetical protein